MWRPVLRGWPPPHTHTHTHQTPAPHPLPPITLPCTLLRPRATKDPLPPFPPQPPPPPTHTQPPHLPPPPHVHPCTAHHSGRKGLMQPKIPSHRCPQPTPQLTPPPTHTFHPPVQPPLTSPPIPNPAHRWAPCSQNRPPGLEPPNHCPPPLRSPHAPPS